MSVPEGLGDLVEMYRRMERIRCFETRASQLYRDGKVPGFVHLAIGQEATAVGACFDLRPQDTITSTHRGHGHALARGLTSGEMFAELMGRETGVCRGRGGSMHIADPARGIFGANGIVGAGIPIAAGAAFAARYRGTDGIVVAFLGDGAIATGAFHEAANLAALWKLPLVLFCENNGFSEFSRFEDQHPVGLAERATGYGLRFRQVDGNDVAAVRTAMTEVVADVRAGNGPYLVEAVTLRHRGHYEGDPQLYRAENDPALLDAADPLGIAQRTLRDLGVEEHVLDEVRAQVDAEIEDAVRIAEAAPLPSPSALHDGVIVVREPSPPAVLEPLAQVGAETWKLFQAVGEALRVELDEDPSVFLAGIDVGRGGNVFGITRGLAEQFPGRLWDTPISETAIMGLGTGAAMAGLRPVVELMYFDFLGVCLDQLMNQAAKLRYMTGGRVPMALTVRTQFGAGRSSGAQHSQSLEALLAHIPGLTVLMPSTPEDAYGLLRSAIRDPNPVVFVENRLQYGMKGPRVPREHLVPIGRAAIRREGSDVTIVSYSRLSIVCVEAAQELAAEGISCEVIDLRTIAPLDVSTVLASVAKTSRLLIVHEAARDFGVGAEIAARVAAEGLWYLDAPITRVGAASTPAPYSPPLEGEWLPGKEDVLRAARELARF
ncbi:alpha-ketoacid dehydrogenase subunit alpha/beta [Phytohabitans kaempferiae]|uniref:dihydrolipoyllysine-residue succinyltransferase n=1 Tax=Phytohabitans kaempferiae TaxID=1620943 RepID=A0ABV6M6H7_9ACTN